MQDLEFKKLGTYGLQGLAALAWGSTLIYFTCLLVQLFSRAPGGVGTEFVERKSLVMVQFVLPAGMTFLSSWLPLRLRRQGNAKMAHLVLALATLLWIPYGWWIYIIMASGE